MQKKKKSDFNSLKMIKLYKQLLQEMTVRFSNTSKSDESMRPPRTKEEEYDLLKVIYQYTYSELYLIVVIEANSRC